MKQSAQSRPRRFRFLSQVGLGAVALCSLLIAACGGGGDGNGGGTSGGGLATPSSASCAAVPIADNDTNSGYDWTVEIANGAKITRANAARFLTQASFGPTDEEIGRVQELGYEGWIDEQFNTATHPIRSLRAYWDEGNPAVYSVDGEDIPRLANDDTDRVIGGFYRHALDLDLDPLTVSQHSTQLRDRAAFALSEIMVVSLRDSILSHHPRMVAGYYDMLADTGMTDFKSLLRAVALHPAMGVYLSHRGNHGEDPARYPGRVPDQNFAREIMQLFSIGLYQLNEDGTPALDANNCPVETYGPEDIKGLSRVFTGLSWTYTLATSGSSTDVTTYDSNYGFNTAKSTLCPDETMESRFEDAANLLSSYHSGDVGGSVGYWDRDFDDLIMPMQIYPCYHSSLEKKFLGQRIPAASYVFTYRDRTGSDPVSMDPYVLVSAPQRTVQSDLDTAIDTLAQHANTAPFISRQLIQRLVTSNPSPAYVQRIARKFKDTHGDMKAVIKAILLDGEARDPQSAKQPGFGKVREPILRFTALMRAFGGYSESGNALMGDTDSMVWSMAQTPLASPSVFNFFRPNYVPADANSAIAGAKNKVAPELQIVNETTHTGWSNFMQDGMYRGFGATDNTTHRLDMQLPFNFYAHVNTGRFSSTLVRSSTACSTTVCSGYTGMTTLPGLAGDNAKLIAYIDEMLLYGQMSSELKAELMGALQQFPDHVDDQSLRLRIATALYLTMVSPEFLVQK